MHCLRVSCKYVGNKQERQDWFVPPEQVKHEASQIVQIFVNLSGYLLLGQVDIHSDYSKKRVPLHERHCIGEAPEQEAQELSQLTQETEESSWN